MHLANIFTMYIEDCIIKQGLHVQFCLKSENSSMEKWKSNLPSEGILYRCFSNYKHLDNYYKWESLIAGMKF